jgi:asparagine synthase (glutamine-hydrolysing)
MCSFNSEGLHDVLSKDVAAGVREFDLYRDMVAMMRVPNSGQRIDSLLYLDSKTYLPGDILTKVDRMSMANSLETRSPLLDHLLIEFVQTIPAQFKLNGHQTKFILKEAVRGLVPEEIINRKKHGFSVPIAAWFKHELKDMVSDVLMDSTTRSRGLFDARAVKRIFREHQEGRRDNSRHLWQLLVLELWYRTFIDHQPAIHFSGVKHMRLTSLSSSTSSVREGHNS